MQRVPLDVDISATFDVNGNARARIGPSVYGHKWHIARMVTSTTDTVLVPELRIYLNGEAPNRLLDGSYSGNLDTSAMELTLQTLDKLVIVWSLGTPGAIATLTVQGIIEDAR